jgi:hypothetical protein
MFTHRLNARLIEEPGKKLRHVYLGEGAFSLTVKGKN